MFAGAAPPAGLPGLAAAPAWAPPRFLQGLQRRASLLAFDLFNSSEVGGRTGGPGDQGTGGPPPSPNAPD